MLPIVNAYFPTIIFAVYTVKVNRVKGFHSCTAHGTCIPLYTLNNNRRPMHELKSVFGNGIVTVSSDGSVYMDKLAVRNSSVELPEQSYGRASLIGKGGPGRLTVIVADEEKGQTVMCSYFDCEDFQRKPMLGDLHPLRSSGEHGKITQVSCGEHHAMLLSHDGVLYTSFFNNEHGQSGIYFGSFWVCTILCILAHLLVPLS